MKLSFEDRLKEIVDHQANMESLWPTDFPSIHTALLAAALRHLHAIIENDPVEAKIAKDFYWDLESEL